MTTIYCISGMGSGQRLFQNLSVPGCSITVIDWLPHEKDESLQVYTQKIRQQISESNPIIIGVCLGGIVAVELSKIVPVKMLFLISSVKTKKELPWYFRVYRSINFITPFLFRFLRNSAFMRDFIFGIGSRELSQLFKTIISETNTDFTDWATKRVLDWNHAENSAKIIHIHGKTDRVIPSKYVSADYLIDGGGHLMILTRGDVIGQIIWKELKLLGL